MWPITCDNDDDVMQCNVTQCDVRTTTTTTAAAAAAATAIIKFESHFLRSLLLFGTAVHLAKWHYT